MTRIANTPDREAVALGPKGTPLLDLDPAMLPVEADGFTDAFSDTVYVYAHAVYGIMGLVGADAANSIRIVWSDDNTDVKATCPDCDDVFNLVDGVNIFMDDDAIVSCAECVGSDDDN